jgi:penicillin-binding protein 2
LNYDVKEFLKKFFTSRLFVLFLVISLMFALVFVRIFSLQIINGSNYQDNFILKIQKNLSINASRGNIYDCNGKLLAYNELANSITISDNSSYSTNSEKNRTLNAELAQVIEVIESNGESISNSFSISMDEDGTYSFNVSGTSLKRFLADVFGQSSYADLEYNKQFGFNESEATAEQVMEYLMYDNSGGFFVIKDGDPVETYSDHINYEIVVIRYAMQEHRYTKYQSTTIAENVGDATVAYMSEHSDVLTGIEIEENTIRKYNDSMYFASIIGYTGKITTEEYETLSETDDSYTLNDIVGRSGLEAYYESYLRGTNGETQLYVDNVGRITEVISQTDSIAGCDLYLSIDSELQEAAYKLLEQEIASIVYSNIIEGEIPISDVYYALLDNNVIDITHFDDEDASETEKTVYSAFSERRNIALNEVKSQLASETPTINNDMTEALLDYFTSAFSLLRSEGILLSGQIDTDDSVYKDWRAGKLSPKEYLMYCISQQWIDITLLDVSDKYADSTEIYNAMCDLIVTELTDDKSFAKDVYKYMVEDGSITGRQLCMMLYDQEVLDYDDELASALENGTITPYNFLCDRINNIEITPAQLALDPCTGSTILTDANTGEIKALVSYPGYDNNKLANGVDAEYFASLNEDLSNPQYNYATQEKTAPGSTFKMVTSTAGLAEGVITTASEITCTGIFTDISNTPRCWIYTSYGGTHGSINVSEALRDSCNYFYYSVGFKLSCLDSGNYDDPVGIAYIQKYAKIYGLDQKTGLEIEENTSEIADAYPVMAAIGQSNNNYTTSALSRYVTAVSTGKLYNYQLMNRIVDANGQVVESYEPEYTDISDTLNQSQWDAIHYGMKLVCEDLSAFNDFPITVAGKTGTAQQVESRPNHALFVGFAPYENPQITIATRISYGYTSHNAAEVSKNILSYYFGEQTLDELLSGNAEGLDSSTANVVTD